MSQAPSPIVAWRHEGALVPPPSQLTEFEQLAQELGLFDPSEYFTSKPLRQWAKDHRNRRYVPEWLLVAWDIHVVADDYD
jgi:hypothetical protein